MILAYISAVILDYHFHFVYKRVDTNHFGIIDKTGISYRGERRRGGTVVRYGTVYIHKVSKYLYDTVSTTRGTYSHYVSHIIERSWFSGKIIASHAMASGSIPEGRNRFVTVANFNRFR